jgi:hypothetical protein
MVKFHSFWQTIEHFLAKYECRIINSGKNLRLLCPPDKNVIERHAARDDYERHGDTKPFIWQCKGEGNKNNTKLRYSRLKQFIHI